VIGAHAIAALLRSDLRKLVRDPVLLISALVPIVLALVLRFGVPVAEAALMTLPEPLDLGPHRPVIGASAMLLAAMLAGWVVGFMLLEERENRTLQAIGVTPLTLRGFVLWRLALPGLIAAIGGLLILLVGDCGVPDFVRASVGLVLAAACAPLFALVLVGFADNEVEGLALAKIGGLSFVLPVVATFVEGPWTWVGGVLPAYWVVRVVDGGPAWMGVVGLACVVLWGAWLLRRFAARID
jgi:fluoroquinolone transport system permease protein